MRLESRSQPPEAGGKQKSRNGHQEASIHEKTSYEAVKIEIMKIIPSLNGSSKGGFL